MRTLIVPCAGSRMIDNLPLFLNTHPGNRLLALKTVDGVYPDHFDKIVFTLLKDVDEAYHAKEKILEANNNQYDISFVVLDKHTSGPAETVYQTIIKADIQGEFAIRDSHAYLEIDKDYSGNFVAGLDLTKYDNAIENLRSKSFISINEQGQILDIVEKHFCSDVISAGFYGFKSSDDYKKAYEHLCDPNYGIKKLYISHVISYLIGYSQRVFHRAKVVDFEDWSSSSAWQKVQKNNSLCFINIDTIEFTEMVLDKLRKMSNAGIMFIGYSSMVVNPADYVFSGVNLLTVVPDCPVTKSKVIIDTLADLDNTMSEI